MTEMQHLFVYGTLGPGKPNEHVLMEIGGDWQAASVRGRLLEQGWGAAMGYPGIVLDNQGEIVEGFVFSSTKLSQNWPQLDAFEGEGYARTLTLVTLSNGDTIEAYIYSLKQSSV